MNYSFVDSIESRAGALFPDNVDESLFFCRRALNSLPFHMQFRAGKKFNTIAKNQDLTAISAVNNLKSEALKYQNMRGIAGLKLSSGDDEMQAVADKQSMSCKSLMVGILKVFAEEKLGVETIAQSVHAIYLALQEICLNHDIFAPSLKKEPTAHEIGTACRKMVCARWWKRQIAKMQNRAVEYASIKWGFVGKGLSEYVSPKAVADYRNRKKRNMVTLSKLEVYNEDLGLTLPMLDVENGKESGVCANHAENRRHEMMTRSRGLEEYLEKQGGYTALFVTATAPTRFHKWSGRNENPAYNSATPRDSHDWLKTRWQRIRAKLGREDVGFSALRTAEPHKDSCTHWHMMLYIKKTDAPNVYRILSDYFLFGDEQDFSSKKELSSRLKNGLEIKSIELGEGSATAYLAKYISKNIDGKGNSQGELFEIETNNTVERVLAWASLWGIRQFQFSNGGKVGVWRELRRIKTKPANNQALLELWKAVNDEKHGADDAADWAKFMEALDVADVELLRFSLSGDMYGDVRIKVLGLVCGNERVLTRIGSWEIREKSSPWACDNNCTVDEKETHTFKQKKRGEPPN